MLAIYTSEWDSLYMDNNKNLFRQKVSFICTPKTIPIKNGKKGGKSSSKLANIERLPSPIPAKFSKEIKVVFKYFKVLNTPQAKKNLEKMYAQASKSISNTKEVLKIKNTFPSLQVKKIKNIQKIINSGSKSKLCINMTTKGPSRKQVIVLINSENIKKFIDKSSSHVSNLNKALKNIKLEIIVNFIRLDSIGIIIVTNNVMSASDLQTIETYIKTANCIDLTGVEVLCLSQSKSYLKIINIPYYQENSSSPITLNIVEDIIKQNHIFNNIVLASKPHVIKVFLKSDMTIVWLNI